MTNSSNEQLIVSGGGTELEHQALRDMKTLYENSISNNKLDDLLPLLDENFSFVTFTDAEFDIKKQSFEQFKKEWNETRTKMLDNGTYQVKLNPERSLIIGDIALARGTAEHKIIKGSGKTYILNGQWSVILRKKDHDWKILRSHSSINAFNNSILEDYVQTKLIQVGSATLIAGLIIGIAASYFFLKNRTV